MAVSDKEGSDNESSKTGVSEKGSDNASNKMGGIKKSGSGKEFDQQTGLEDTIDFYVEKLNQSFEIFKINTVEAQAAYIANAYVESDQFRYMTETQKAVKTNKPYASDPRNITLDTTYLSSPARGNNYKSGGPIHPVGEEDWQQSLIGRGPLQVTNRENYIQALAVMEKRAEELERDDPYSQEAKDLREAIDNIKTDPREAANPKYAFMFSAAFMKMSDDHGIRGDEKATKGNVTSWMGTQWPKQEKVKMDAYGKAKDMLMVKWDEDQRKVNENMMKSNMDTNEENMRWEEKGYGDYESKTNEGVG